MRRWVWNLFDRKRHTFNECNVCRFVCVCIHVDLCTCAGVIETIGRAREREKEEAIRRKIVEWLAEELVSH